MGVLFLLDEEIPGGRLNDKRTPCTLDVADNHSVPEIRIGPVGYAHRGWTAAFDDWTQFEQFVEAVNSLHFRLKEMHE